MNVGQIRVEIGLGGDEVSSNFCGLSDRGCVRLGGPAHLLGGVAHLRGIIPAAHDNREETWELGEFLV